MSSANFLVNFDDRFFAEDLQKIASNGLRDAVSAWTALTEKRCMGAAFTGWYDWPLGRGKSLLHDVQSFQQSYDVYYDTVLVIGIGGSYLGTRAIAEALSHSQSSLLVRSGKADGRRPLVYAGQHLSEAAMLELLDFLDDRRPVVNVISKTGTTTEPAVAFRIIRDYLEKRFGKGEAARRVAATTDGKSGALRRLSTELGYKTFEVPDDVGGRFSVLTAVGILPLALAGFDIGQLMLGAADFFQEVRRWSVQGQLVDHPVIRYAASRYAASANGKNIELLAYGEPKLGYFVEWWKQLFGESEGKDGKGIFPAGICYTTDLHSLGQYVQDGMRNLFETFLFFDEVPAVDPRPGAAVERRLKVPRAQGNIDELAYLEGRTIQEINRAAMDGSMLAHSQGGAPCLSLTLRRLDEYHLGALIAFFEVACGISAAMLGVNPYDQPGVEAYKKNLFALMGKPGFEELGAEVRRLVHAKSHS